MPESSGIKAVYIIRRYIMKKFKKYIIVASLLIASQSVLSMVYLVGRSNVNSDFSFSTAFVPVQAVTEVVEVVAEELLNLK